MDGTISGQLLLPDGDDGVRLSPGTLAIRGGRIESVREGLDPRADLGGPGFFVTPGFVDTHLHLAQFDSIGIDNLELLEWLNTAIFPAEGRWADTDYAAAMTERVAAELLGAGTTSVAAYATVHHEGAQAAIAALARTGISGHVGQVLMDRHAPGYLTRPAQQLLEEAANLKAVGRVQPAVTPRFAVTCSEELLRGAGELATATGWLVQTHLSETRAECELVSRLFPGRSYTQVYEETGLLTPRTVLGHGIWLDEGERTLLAKNGCAIAHCPTANRFLAAGEMPRAVVKAAGVRVALGSDVAGGPDRSMVRVARAMIDTAKQVGGGVPRAGECWHQITGTNADSLGLSGVGRLKAGGVADVLVVQPRDGWQDSPDPLSMLLYAWDDRWLRLTMTAGEVRYQAP